MAAARRYHRTHHHLDVPQAFEDEGGYPLDTWLTWQRHLHTTGALDQTRTAALERLDIIWNPRQQAWDRGLAHAAAFATLHGHLAAPVDHHDGDFPIGRWLATQRTRADQLTPARAQALQDLDPWWNPPWPLTWQRTYHAAHHHTAAGRSLRDLPRSYVTDDGHRLGEWLHTQRTHPERLHPEQQCLLAHLGLNPPAPPAPQRGPSHERAFQRALAAARAFHTREGHLNVPQRHIEDLGGDPVRLGQWINNARRRRDRLTADRIAQLDARHAMGAVALPGGVARQADFGVLDAEGRSLRTTIGAGSATPLNGKRAGTGPSASRCARSRVSRLPRSQHH
ncbi:helicase associated domain-containing protein [Streptomyces sp. NBC_01794]|uniref:helicase associated domain-containing protein n=1 Tax=Streptomyces sp. NBC_01794 TaxID=2975942 RepID=UPI00308C84CF|nr:helicase associated domain-containing protein [Streptomyces sp. NBC_01794]WSB05223.1 helicase associated domain-containing protein [Streptomyces sp. NBC_01794]